MKLGLPVVLSFIALTGVTASAVQAATIPVTNASFETPTLSNNSPVSATSYSWTADGSTTVGVIYKPATTSLTAPADGSNVAGLASATTAGGVQTLAQTLTGNSYAADTTYTLKFFVAQRLESNLPFAGYDAKVYAGSTLVAETTSSTMPTGVANGTFAPITLSWISPSSVAANQTLRLVFGTSSSISNNNARTALDAISFTSAVPEPASLAALALGGLGMLVRRRR